MIHYLTDFNLTGFSLDGPTPISISFLATLVSNFKNINCDLWLGWGDRGRLYSRDRGVLKLIKDIDK